MHLLALNTHIHTQMLSEIPDNNNNGNHSRNEFVGRKGVWGYTHKCRAKKINRPSVRLNASRFLFPQTVQHELHKDWMDGQKALINTV